MLNPEAYVLEALPGKLNIKQNNIDSTQLRMKFQLLINN